MTQDSFPIIDISPLNRYMQDESSLEGFFEDREIKDLSDKFVGAFMEWGFLYLTGHGIDQNIIDCAYQVSKDFFQLNTEVKEKFKRMNDDGENWGWVPFNVETFEKSRPYDLKECFNYQPTTSKAKVMNETMPEFMKNMTSFFESCIKLSMLLLHLLTMALPTTNQRFLASNHEFIGNLEKNASICRMLYYPSIKDENTVLKEQLRCGEHSDYGTITLLFQDKPGLQVLSPSGNFIDATPIPGTIVMNGGDMLEIWSSGKFKATKHRVVVPTDDFQTARQSLTLFVHPDNDITVSCLDGSTNYKPANPFEHLMKMFKDTYG